MQGTVPENGKPKPKEGGRNLRRFNWWGIFGLLCGIGSAYLSVKILFEAMTLLGMGP